jgi:hypothetical protein
MIAVRLGWYYRINVAHRHSGGDASSPGGMYNKKGEGVAQKVRDAINVYLRDKPTADWNELWQNVDSHYRTANGMRNAMLLLSIREAKAKRKREWKAKFKELAAGKKSKSQWFKKRR